MKEESCVRARREKRMKGRDFEFTQSLQAQIR
jgi:hypothetical protein